MKKHRYIHVFFVAILLLLLAALPIARHTEMFASQGTDANTGASMELPDEPSGEFVVLINESIHSDSLDQWEKFFTGKEVEVIFDDINCLVSKGDAAAIQMATVYLATLPENQMTLDTEDPTLLASKAESGYADVAVFSEEMADAIGFDADNVTNMKVIYVRGGDDPNES